MEKLNLSIGKFAFSGEGTDPDGDFVVNGTYDPITHIVQMTRRYTLAPKNPGQVGYPFQYLGRWDGMLVSGRWFMPDHPEEGGPFEMWPEREEDREELAIQIDEMVVAGPKALPASI